MASVSGKRILIVTDAYPPDNSVVGRLAHEDAKALRALGAQVAVFAAGKGLASLERSGHDGVAVYRTPRATESPFWRLYYTLYNPRAERDFAAVLGEFRPTVVHFHNIHEHLSFRMPRIAKRAGAKTLLSAHDVMLFHYGKLVEFIDPARPVCAKQWDYRVSAWQQVKRFKKRYNPLRRVLVRRALRSVDVLLAVSRGVKDALQDNGIKGAEVLYNGLDSAAWQAPQEATDAFVKKFGLAGKKAVLFGGRLNHIKGGSKLLEAFAAAGDPQAVLVVAAQQSPYLDALQKRAGELGVAGRVVATGWLESGELVAAFSAAAVVAVPSLCFESFSMMTLQGMAAGRPVIASCFGGPQELVEDGETGYSINPYNAEGFASRLRVLLSDQALRERMGRKARERAELFSLERHVEALAQRYAELG